LTNKAFYYISMSWSWNKTTVTVHRHTSKWLYKCTGERIHCLNMRWNYNRSF